MTRSITLLECWLTTRGSVPDQKGSRKNEMRSANIAQIPRISAANNRSPALKQQVAPADSTHSLRKGAFFFGGGVDYTNGLQQQVRHFNKFVLKKKIK
jgi:hypothetical protein